ncbi:hypothetical protein [Rummeliibacillus stabekisii]|uniref:hypothetical protein n=1 Tax=Rummeliibacillus stabekisii TaxID=241244 RepID=UPI00372107F6
MKNKINDKQAKAEKIGASIGLLIGLIAIFIVSALFMPILIIFVVAFFGIGLNYWVALIIWVILGGLLLIGYYDKHKGGK